MERKIPGAELFFGESVIQYLADIADEAYDAESDAEGFLLGGVFSDPRGDYAVISGITQDPCRRSDAVGCFRISENGACVTPADLGRIVKLMGYKKTYVMMVDSAQCSVATYVVENGASRKIQSAMIENA